MQILDRARLLLLAGILAGCSATPGASPPAATTHVSTAAATAASTSSAAPTTGTVAPTKSAYPMPAMTTIEPAAIDLPGSTGLISITTDGTTVWASINDAIVRIDAATSKVTSLSAPSRSDDSSLQIAEDGLWMTRWGGGRVYRLDPETGGVLLSVEMPAAVRIALVGGDLWIGNESTSEMVRVDRVTGTIDRTLKIGAYGTAGLGDLWLTHPSPKDAANHIGSADSVERIDPETGATKSSFKVQQEGNCSLYGEFPDNVWVTCFGREVIPRAATRLDPTTGTVGTVSGLPPSHGGSVVIVNGRPWFVGTFEDAAGNPLGGLLRLNPMSGAVEQWVSIGSADPDPAVVAGAALWIPDEAGHRMLRVELADL